jgi:hypothetical protein
MFPIRESVSPKYANDEFDSVDITDFSGGVNITDSPSGLAANQFEIMLNFYFDRQKTLYSRPPFRPFMFGASADTTFGTTSAVTAILDYQVFRETIANWSYNSELHVVTYTKTTGLYVDAYKSGTGWTNIWNSATAADVSVCPFKINAAFDLIIFPNDDHPVRWLSSSNTTTDLGLTKPSVSATLTQGNNSQGFLPLTGGTMYYKFSYFYDDSNTTTKYGESALSETALSRSITAVLSTTGGQQVTIDFTSNASSGITKALIYRAPYNTPEGPYRYIGYTAVSTSSPYEITTYIDSTPFDFEGAEGLTDESNPSVTTVLKVVNAATIGSYLVGFDATMKNKLVYSNSGQPDVWHPLNFDYLDSNGLAVVPFNRKIYVFTGKSCYQKDAMETVAFKISNIGCAAKRSVQEVGNGIIWMDYDTVYFADFVQQYGAKGDFPLDIGHPISKSIRRYDANELVHSEFFERRYYLTYSDTDDFTRKCYVFDIDIGAWTQHSMEHTALARGNKILYSIGFGNSKYYVYEHDYIASVAIGDSLYEGKDYHDYGSITTTSYKNIATILTNIKKSKVEFGGDFRKTFISSMSMDAEGVYINATVSMTGDDFTANKVFTDTTMGTGSYDTFPATYDNAVYSPSSGVADSTYYGYVGFRYGAVVLHKKINRVVKSNQISITIVNTDSRDLRILGMAIYYKLLPKVA